MPSRRDVLGGLGAAGLLGCVPGIGGAAAAGQMTRTIPASGERIPVIGMGTSRTFDVGADAAARQPLAAVLRTLFDQGGTIIDSSPMYGSAEQVTGELLEEIGRPDGFFAATKVWADGREAGIAQMNDSFRLLGVRQMALMQVHNLRDWRTHVGTLRQWKEEGRIRYMGITTSAARQYEDFAAVMRAEPWDFVQLNYSLGERESEQLLLPLAQERGMATMINRPFMRGELFARVRGQALPEWAAEFDCASWGQFFLKFILAHPAVTCVIPATASARNMADNMLGGVGRLPDKRQRQRMLELFS